LKRNAGFTMVEAVVIIGVLAILAGIVTPLVIREVAKSKVARVRTDMEAIATAFNQYFADTSYWPEKWDGAANDRVDLDEFPALYANSESLIGWDGPYLERGVLSGGVMQATKGTGDSRTGLVDPWKQPFQVVYGIAAAAGAGAAGAISLVSAGPNQVHDTSDANALMGEATNDDIVRVITRRVH
jgi:type II secretory pathway pseudopilin PulG